MDLIFAEATPPGRGGVSVIRLSGDGARSTAEALVGSMPNPRHAYFRNLFDENEVVDQVLAMWFAAGSSFTGEEVAELHLHGAPVISKRVSAILLAAGVRFAEAGEFTRRAFLNGRMDLSEIEGLGDLLAAETEAQRKLAMRSIGGELSQKSEEWRAWLIEAGAFVEVSVDFADEEVPDDVPDAVYSLLENLRQSIEQEIHGFSGAERIRQGFEVAIVGPPNAGKSSLLNRIAKRDVAIVSTVAGTTRDVIELRMDLQGLPVTILDTAGLRTSNDEVEVVGIERAKSRAVAADLRIHLSEDGFAVDDLYVEGDIVAKSKSDLHKSNQQLELSSMTGEGVDSLLTQIFDMLSVRVANAGIVSHERQLNELQLAHEALTDIDNLPVEILAEHLRKANHALDRLLGRIDAEDYLDKIFSSFCIGK
ncbi:tRNA uridine-5-carboxymethylaminomethyl(34) synthesis GTPase MnmE [Paracoccus sp. JM45]|uniref:tRNA uridine-5-carboxymethylaminomethyl(34) synthesis GTPase MnmE n=1 Tax=Paracoccus sp. JM45 TaxID=2283626 RepID=UPI000E6CEEA5|nr:tRNA uridine-5-carboxymethylaminomethyl(34) synthesis GTPase MnmE [Paracoccus sp. JM45]RJE80960.1 tRNA uridine-5-carboxymethylaminomethyl(34) synthesis GTPase MnmE [Paracoccus sp. JM45]